MKVTIGLVSRIFCPSDFRSIELTEQGLFVEDKEAVQPIPFFSILEISSQPRKFIFQELSFVLENNETLSIPGLFSWKCRVLKSRIQQVILLEEIKLAFSDFEELLTRDTWFGARHLHHWFSDYEELLDEASSFAWNSKWLKPHDEMVLSFVLRDEDLLDRLRMYRNETWTQDYLYRNKGWFDEQGGKFPLTQEQSGAVILDEDHSLVVAGAGTGKTATIVAKAGWLMEKRGVPAADILLLAFQKKAAEEIRERLHELFGVSCDVKTFHSLGYGILGKVEEERRPLSEYATDDAKFFEFVEGRVRQLLQSGKLDQAIFKYLLEYVEKDDSPFLFDSMKEWVADTRGVKLRTLQGELVKSREERIIADWYFLHSIPYVYEPSYDQIEMNEERRTASPDFKTYTPDFYIPALVPGRDDWPLEYGIYHEHFALDFHGNPPDFMNQGGSYEKGVEWKRNLHEDHGNCFIETHSHHSSRRVLFDVLDDWMAEWNVPKKMRPKEEIIAAFEKRIEWTKFSELVANFIAISKANDYSTDELREVASTSLFPERSNLFLSIIEHVRIEYEEALEAEGRIDFADMIKTATQYVRENRFESSYRHIIVDEFQDISRGRSRLISALKEQTEEASIYGVGDDWQSIFRFTGSDLRRTTQFEEYWKPSEIAVLSRTFRFNDEILKASSQFVQENPTQRRKELTAATSTRGRPIIVRLEEEGGTHFRGVKKVLEKIMAEVEDSKQPRKVYILGRYTHTLPLEYVERWKAETARNSSYAKMLDIQCLTAHRSKGLEAEDVIILGLNENFLGFPSQRVEDPVMGMVLPELESFAFSEERRLFYVALTRAKERVFLFADTNSPSRFATELSQPEYANWVESPLGRALFECPICESPLVKREKKNGGYFWGCTGFPKCNYLASHCAECGEAPIIKNGDTAECPRCEHSIPACPQCSPGLLNKKAGLGYRPFWGCSHYSLGCKFKAQNCPDCSDSPQVKVENKLKCNDCDSSYEACPDGECDGYLILREGKYGQFLGCSNYPKCQYTKQLRERGNNEGDDEALLFT